MTKEVFGPFQANDEVIRLVSNLELKGYKSENITVFANSDDFEELDKRTDVSVESSVTDEEEPTFMDKVKRVFSNDAGTHPHLHDRLLNSAVTDKQAKEYVDAIEDGGVLVIANNDLKMGHDATNEPMVNNTNMSESAIKRDY
ncbi:general stress protein [Virgibacillus halodenitrificans]|uniref:general stress protein n=1 Tax=Virgibacillus halodenitrificans TaxID=1482 RepID=UPI002DB99D91|nr:general stress protein [Virgibacillus halodenitrificans]MEC2158089.1 general stress protein [Virgibacillus halodenitrificans]